MCGIDVRPYLKMNTRVAVQATVIHKLRQITAPNCAKMLNSVDLQCLWLQRNGSYVYTAIVKKFKNFKTEVVTCLQ